MKIIFISIISLFILAPTTFASQEGVLKLDTFTMKSQGIGESGPILISGEKNKQDGFTFLKIEAFGKTYEISMEDLNKIPKVPYNGIQLSYERGYDDLGGKTIYIVLQKGFISGIQQKVLISLSENGTIKIKQQK